MANTDTLRVSQFSATLKALVQQMGSRLRGTTLMKDGIIGKRFSEDQIGAFTAQIKTARNSDTPNMAKDFYRRWATMFDYELGTLHDKEDQLKEIVDPTSPIAQSFANALGRGIDDRIIAAASADATTGENGDGTTSFDTTNNRIATGGTGLTVSKVLDAFEILEENDCADPMEDPRFFIYSAKSMRELLNSTEVKSADYNTVKALAQGKIDTWMGFKFIRSQRLALSSGVRTCLAYTRSGIVLGMAKDITVKMDERADKSYAKQVYASMSVGATRLEEKKVVEILCTES